MNRNIQLVFSFPVKYLNLKLFEVQRLTQACGLRQTLNLKRLSIQILHSEGKYAFVNAIHN